MGLFADKGAGLFSKDGNRLVYRYDAEKLWVEPWGENSLRVRSTKNAVMPGTVGDDEDWALLPPKSIAPEISISNNSAVIKNGKIELRITHLGQIFIYNSKGELLLVEYLRNRRDQTDHRTFSSLEVEAREFKPIIGGEYELTMRFESTSPDEKRSEERR